MTAQNGRPKLMIIGLDGATYRVLDPMRRAGALPNIGKIMDRGTWGLLRSTVPTNSAAAWVSFMTGKNPARHGVFEFQVRRVAGGPKSIAGSHAIAGETLWEILSRQSKRLVTLNVPITYPPMPVDGALVSGIPIPGSGREWAYPAGLAGDVERAVDGYVISVPWRDVLGEVEPFLNRLTTMTRKRAAATRYLMERFEPEVATVVFVGPDRLQHCLWQYMDPNHAAYREKEARTHQSAIENYFHELDSAVGEVLAYAGDDTTIVLLSDHGFQAAEKHLNLNEWLEEQGLLRFRRVGLWSLLEPLRKADNAFVWRLRSWWHFNAPSGFRRLNSKPGIDWSHTKAYAPWGFQQGVSVNLAGREGGGIVPPGESYEELRRQLLTALRELKDPETGRRVVKDAWLREEGYEGPFLDFAADVIIIPEEGYSSSPPPRRKTLFRPTGWASGCHERDGILVVAGCGIRSGAFEAGPEIQDIAPTVLHLLGLPVPEDMDGRVLEELFEPRLRERLGPPRFEAPAATHGRAAADVFTENETKELEEKLRGLGYLG